MDFPIPTHKDDARLAHRAPDVRGGHFDHVYSTSFTKLTPQKVAKGSGVSKFFINLFLLIIDLQVVRKISYYPFI